MMTCGVEDQYHEVGFQGLRLRTICSTSARAMAQDAILAYLESLRKDHLPIRRIGCL
jgi:hypothetical protein